MVCLAQILTTGCPRLTGSSGLGPNCPIIVNDVHCGTAACALGTMVRRPLATSEATLGPKMGQKWVKNVFFHN